MHFEFNMRWRQFAWTSIVLVLTTSPAWAQFENNARPPRPEVTLPDGPVRQVILRSCTQCHGIDEYGYYAMDRGAWSALIERMKTARSGVVEGAVISSDDREILLDWLVAEFGPDNTHFPRQYIIPEVSEEDQLSDADAHALLNEACASCHTPLDGVINTKLAEEELRLLFVDKIATGTQLLIDEADPLIEWLIR